MNSCSCSERHSEAEWSELLRVLEEIKPKYDLMNRIMSLGSDVEVRRRAIRLAAPAETVLDIGAGVGTSTELLIEELEPSYVVALDPSPELLAGNRGYLRAPHLVDRVVAVAESVPVRDSALHLSASFFAARDFREPRAALSEMRRVARKTLVVDLVLHRSLPGRLLGYAWFCLAVPLAALLVGAKPSHYLALCRTLRGWMTVDELAEAAGGDCEARSEKMGYVGVILCPRRLNS